MNVFVSLQKATSTGRGLLFLLLVGCNSTPDVVSFNTPELCEPDITGIASFSLAKVRCDDDCRICIETTFENHAFTYSVARDGNCVCKAPEVHTADAGATPETDAGLDPDTGLSNDASPRLAPDGCRSQLNLTQGSAANYCNAKTDCHVCVERVDFDNKARRYMAHECGCPSPYRLE